MIREFCSNIYQSKNMLMLLSVALYVLALFSVFSGNVLLVSSLITILLVIMLIKEYFPIKVVFIWLFIFYLGIANTSFRLKDTDELLNLAPRNAEITGTVLSIPQGLIDGKPKFYLNAKDIKFGNEEIKLENEKVLVSFNILNSDNKAYNSIQLYNTYSFNGRLSVPFKAGNPSQFDYGNYLKNYDTYAVFYAKDYTKIDKQPTFLENLLQKVNKYREHVISIHSEYLKTPNLEILGGIVFGDDAVSPPEKIKKSFVNSGLLHILAASGMNVAFIYFFFYQIMSLLKINYRVKVSLGIFTILIYLLMTGMGVSVVRAALMLIFVLFGKLINRDAHSVALLSFVGLLMLLYNPMYINDVGFQLSFIVTLGLLVTSPLVIKMNNKFLDIIVGTVSIPIIAQLWVIPLQIFYFNNISLYAIFANIMSNPILMLISFGGFVSSLLCVIYPFAHFICRVFDLLLSPLITLLVNISDFWGHLPNSAIQTTHPSVLQVLLYYGILLCVINFFYKRCREKYWKVLKHVLVCLLLVLSLTMIPIKNSNLEITAFDVGNADAFLVKTPQNKYFMIDTGKSGYNGGKSQAEYIIIKYLNDIGVKNLEFIIVTHFDNDHCGGAESLMKNLKVGKIYVNNIKDDSLAAKNIYNTARKTKTDVVLAENSQSVYDNDVKITNYISGIKSSDNNSSIVTVLEYGKFKMLFTGDAGIEAMHDLLSKLPKNINVLKVPHHGAAGVLDKAVLTYLNPECALVSVGENKFGHPNSYTMSLISPYKIYRTDINNSVRIVVNGKGYAVTTYDINKRKYIQKKVPR